MFAKQMWAKVKYAKAWLFSENTPVITRNRFTPNVDKRSLIQRAPDVRSMRGQ